MTSDVSREADCATVAALIRERRGRSDVLVDVAGSFPARPIDEVTAADFRQVTEHADAQVRARAITRAETADDPVVAIAFLASPDADGGRPML